MPRLLRRGMLKGSKSYLGEKSSDLSLSCAVSRRVKVHHYHISELNLNRGLAACWLDESKFVWLLAEGSRLSPS